MESNINRRREIFDGVLPPNGSKEYFETIEKLQRLIGNDKEQQEFEKKCWEKATKSLEAQLLSNCDLITEHSLRNYLTEFNNRAWKYGLRSMPIMFNIMEAFFNYRKPEIYFELIEEENYLISYFDFVDFITSNDFKENKTLIEESIISDIIYNFNVAKDLEEIKFKSTEGEEFIVAGVSIIRRNDEVTLLMTTGRKKTTNLSVDKSSFNLSNDNPNKSELIKEMKESLAQNDLEYEYLDNDKKYVKVLVACRIDLETMTVDARYVAEETNLTFKIKTDEVDGFLNVKGEFTSKELEEAFKNSAEKIDDYNAIFEAIKLSMYLPYYFNQNEKFIIEENIETDFKSKYNNPILKRKYSNVYGHKCSVKALYSLDLNNILSPDKIKLRDDLFKVQSNGYWKKLLLDEVGLDKKGNSIHGRTWVNQSLSWFEAKEEDLIIEKETELYKDKNAGFIYILRNPVMESDVFKIGLTRNEVDERIGQLSKTSVPDKFYKMQEWHVKDCIKAEKEIHLLLSDYRVDPRREFFKIDNYKAIKVIKEVVDKINKE
jgi:hypothetical protein